MRKLLNTLYVTTEGAWVRLDHDTLKVEITGSPTFQIPLHHLGAVVCVGDVMVTPAALHRCAADGRTVAWLDRTGRFAARVEGPVSGNVLLRRSQHLSHGGVVATGVARAVVAGKLHAQRAVLARGARNATLVEDGEELRAAEIAVTQSIPKLAGASFEELRGHEGVAAKRYFEAFPRLIKGDRTQFSFVGRSRRPPRDRVNALLSFVYTLITGDCVAAVEGVGLDPQVGFFHELRPGRPALALDLVEEIRPSFADRLVLNLINLRQLDAEDFEERPGGAFSLTKDGRKTVLAAYQRRKAEEVQHPLLETNVPWGLVPHVQAQLLARHLRGDLGAYVPFQVR